STLNFLVACEALGDGPLRRGPQQVVPAIVRAGALAAREGLPPVDAFPPALPVQRAEDCRDGPAGVGRGGRPPGVLVVRSDPGPLDRRIAGLRKDDRPAGGERELLERECRGAGARL